ncbi:unnamed protein product [Clonostachys rosea]|uniref:SnoaL-like domain-containing protein n=1 Tax=Bionectria ochroleuca TaxID=29856 RepID=A0ABY6UJD4_BIOOC|nr:unnamed protein product [Clonostachys rosea]
MSRTVLKTQTETFFNVLDSLRANSSTEAFESFGKLFDEKCVANPISMREHLDLKHGRQEIVDYYKAGLRETRVTKRQIQSLIVDEDGLVVACEMKNRLLVKDLVLDPFHETAIIRFNGQGSIISLNIYSCRSPVVALLQKSTGKGPYADADHEIKTLKLDVVETTT